MDNYDETFNEIEKIISNNILTSENWKNLTGFKEKETSFVFEEDIEMNEFYLSYKNFENQGVSSIIGIVVDCFINLDMAKKGVQEYTPFMFLTGYHDSLLHKKAEILEMYLEDFDLIEDYLFNFEGKCTEYPMQFLLICAFIKKAITISKIDKLFGYLPITIEDALIEIEEQYNEITESYFFENGIVLEINQYLGIYYSKLEYQLIKPNKKMLSRLEMFDERHMFISADPDIISDDTIIDIKTVRKIKYNSSHWKQVMRYAFYYNKFYSSEVIKKVGIYYSTTGDLVITELSNDFLEGTNNIDLKLELS
ncbi:hypothetical protein ACODJC_01980 [Vagococcus fluvialis]|uniref:hypothetical protein n=1 Tax=Vagococcus fluvialis TaxID=2738 RepID=UPI003B59975B